MTVGEGRYTVADVMQERIDEASHRTLVEAIEDVWELLGWHADDEADEANTSPSDMVAHVNGLARRKLADALELAENPIEAAHERWLDRVEDGTAKSGRGRWYLLCNAIGSLWRFRC